MDFTQVDVFAEAPYQGNPVAVFTDAAELTTSQMQSIAAEMNLSETTFVTDARDDTYDVRIFTPVRELPFAGHPTIGTGAALLADGRIRGTTLRQRSGAGTTTLQVRGDELWLQRPGEVEPDLGSRIERASLQVARALGLQERQVGLEARELGRSGLLQPAFADAGLRQLLVPVVDLASLEACRPAAAELANLRGIGAYCFTAVQAGRIRARGFYPELGIAEDPATGSAAAALGLYLADRLGAIDFEVLQGIEMGRPSRIGVRARPGAVEVGGRTREVLRGTLLELPGA